MIVVWRLVKRRHADDAFTGEGARRYGGRWNHPGTPMVYASGSLSLATLELFIHLGPEGVRLQFVSFRIEILEGLRVDELKPERLPRNWRDEPPQESTQKLGTDWAKSRSAVALCVPSVIVPVEHNYALNPLHPDFRSIIIGNPEPFSLDPRMWKHR